MAYSIKSPRKSNHLFIISETFLNRCADAAAQRAILEQEASLAQLDELEKIGRWVMNQRIRRGETRQVCSQRVGIDPFDLMAIENSACSPKMAYELLKKLRNSEKVI